MTQHQSFKPVGMSNSIPTCNGPIDARGPLTIIVEENWQIRGKVSNLNRTAKLLLTRLLGEKAQPDSDQLARKDTIIPDGVFNNIAAFQYEINEELKLLENNLETLVKHTE